MSERGSVEAMLTAYGAAVYEKDVEAFVALYDEDVRVFDLWGSWSYDGAGPRRQMVTEWFGSLGSERVAVESEDVQTTIGDDVAVMHAFLTFKGLSADGEELRAMNNRLTWALRRTGNGSWKVVHEHTSAPADFETSKVMLQRLAPSA
jgi:uncharacterized protein (TIGR02246 family)